MDFGRYHEERIGELVAFALDPKKWITSRADGVRAYYPKEMETNHLKNTIRMIADGRMERDGRTSCNGLTIAQWKRIFENELYWRAFNERR